MTQRLTGLLALLILAAFAIPAMVNALRMLIPVLLAFVIIIGVGSFIFDRFRRW
jgi:hypothetical protein